MNKDNDKEEQCINIHFETFIKDFDDIAYEPIKVEDKTDDEDMFGYNTQNI